MGELRLDIFMACVMSHPPPVELFGCPCIGKKKPIVYYIVCGQGAQLEISAVEACRMEILVILSEYEEPVVGLQ